MNDLDKFKQLPYSSQIACICWAIGTLLFLLAFLFPREEAITIAGIIYIAMAGIINGILLLYLFGKLLSNNKSKSFYLTQIAILLANIPIAVLYAYHLINQFTTTNNF